MSHPVYYRHKVNLSRDCQEPVAIREVAGIYHINIVFFNFMIEFVGFLNDIYSIMFRFGEQASAFSCFKKSQHKPYRGSLFVADYIVYIVCVDLFFSDDDKSDIRYFKFFANCLG